MVLQLTTITKYINKALDDGKKPLVFFWYLAKAFDTVHQLVKILPDFGIKKSSFGLTNMFSSDTHTYWLVRKVLKQNYSG